MTDAPENTSETPCPLPKERVAWWQQRLRHFPRRRAVLLPLLHDLQDHAGCLTKRAMQWAAEFVGVTPVEVYGVATFYWMYDYEPRARHRIAVCHNISCDLRGMDRIVETIQRELGVESDGRPSADGEWSLRTVECMGACTAAPMMDINGCYYENLTPERTREILRDLKSGRQAAPTAPAPLPPLPEVAWTYDIEEAAQ